MRRRGTTALVASPVLVGAVTVLIALIAVYISYNANKGLPFVPTYDLKAELPSGAKLVEGNEVRAGGFRVGVVDKLAPKTITQHGRNRTIALATLKLDKTVDPLAVDTTFRTRERSALGLKYIQLTPGHARRTFKNGDTVPLKNASQPLELENVNQIFDRKTRPDVRNATTGFGDAFAGRGASINTAIEALNPFFKSLTPVARNLADPRTELDQFFLQLGRASAQAAPVAHTQAVLFTDMADTFAAISRCDVCLQQTIEKSPPTLDESIRSFPVQRSFYTDFADLSRRLRPAARQLPRSLPALNVAFKVGTPVLPKTTKLNERLQGAFKAAENLFDNPNTLLALKDIRTALHVTRPALEFIAPYQTVCNSAIYFFGALGELQSSVQNGPTGGGTVLNQNVKQVNNDQANSQGSSATSRPWGIPPTVDPIGAEDPSGNALGRVYSAPYNPAIDAQGNADCQIGQHGWMKGPLTTAPRYGRAIVPGSVDAQHPEGIDSGGSWAVTNNDFPGLRGGNYVTRRLGIKNLRDVK
jgi:phospholipid/cholesterol/gamma-HCH transport system substrate-binding protein